MEQQEQDRDAALEVLKLKLRRAAGQAERGEVMDGDEFFDGLLAKLGRKVEKPPAA